jgi:hypothetical protein
VQTHSTKLLADIRLAIATFFDISQILALVYVSERRHWSPFVYTELATAGIVLDFAKENNHENHKV